MFAVELNVFVTDFVTFLTNGLLQGGIYALIALGYTMVYGVLKLVNFAHSEVYMVGAFTGYLLAALGLPLPLVLLAAACVSGVLAVVIERLFYRPLRHTSRLTGLIASLGVSLLLQNAFQLYFGPDPKIFRGVDEDVSYIFGDLIVTRGQITILAVTFSMMLALWLFVEKSAWGRATKAVSFNRDASLLMGINVDRVVSLTFFLGGALAGIGGVLVGLYQGSIEPLMGVAPGLKAFLASVIGGIGSIPGAVVGSLALGVIENLYTGFFDSASRDVAAFVLLTVFLLARPAGLIGTRVREKV